jgi:hypothetical protein
MGFGGLILMFLFVMMSRASNNGSGSANTGGEEASEPTSAPAGAGDSARRGIDSTIVGNAVEGSELRDGPTRTDGCFRSGSSATEVRAVMGAPDSVVFGEWKYGPSSVSFGYGVVLDYENPSGNLKLC